MEKRIHLYVSKKNPALWLTGLLMLASVVARIAVFSQVEDTNLWRQIVWPSAAIILFVLMVFLTGEEMLYRTAVPVWMLGICAGWQLCYVLAERPLWFALACICVLFFCGSYTSILAGNHKPWLLLPLYLVPLGMLGYTHGQLVSQLLSAKVLLPGYLLIAGFLTMLFALKVHTDGKYHPTWKDRADGRYIRSSPAIEQITPFIMPNRCGANILFDESVEISEHPHFNTSDGSEICGMAGSSTGLFRYGTEIPAGAESVPWQYLFYLYGQPGHQAGLPPSL